MRIVDLFHENNLHLSRDRDKRHTYGNDNYLQENYRHTSGPWIRDGR
jgi:hypothetical protein